MLFVVAMIYLFVRDVNIAFAMTWQRIGEARHDD